MIQAKHFIVTIAFFLFQIEVSALEFPYISCPLSFQYVKDWEFGGWFGLVSLPKPSTLDDITLEVNMTYNGPISLLDNLRLALISTEDELKSAKFLKWAVIFPFQNNYPKLTSLRLNKVQMCTNYPDPVLHGVKQTHLWARSVIKKGIEAPTEYEKRTRKSLRKEAFFESVDFASNRNSLPGVPVLPFERKIFNRRNHYQDLSEEEYYD